MEEQKAISPRPKLVQVPTGRVFEEFQLDSSRRGVIREATEGDIEAVQLLYRRVYHGKYSLEFATHPEKLRQFLAEKDQHLLLLAESTEDSSGIVGCVVFEFDPVNRLGKAGGAVVAPEFRGSGLGSNLLKQGMAYLTRRGEIDVIYATSRTVNEAPSKMVAEAGFTQMGIFPNAVEVENMEHLNLDIFLSKKALDSRRKKPYVLAPYHEIYDIARRRLGLERCSLVTEFSPLTLKYDPLEFNIDIDEAKVAKRFKLLHKEGRLANSFFPFYVPNLRMISEDRGTEVFMWFSPKHKQAALLGYRTDRVNIHDLLDSIAKAVHKHGASYVEFLVDVYDYRLQQQAYTARFIPSAYFPAMRLKEDGFRDDVFVLSRTFSLLDFSGSVMKGDNREYLKAYLRRYYELYLKPILGG